MKVLRAPDSERTRGAAELQTECSPCSSNKLMSEISPTAQQAHSLKGRSGDGGWRDGVIVLAGLHLTEVSIH